MRSSAILSLRRFLAGQVAVGRGFRSRLAISTLCPSVAMLCSLVRFGASARTATRRCGHHPGERGSLLSGDRVGTGGEVLGVAGSGVCRVRVWMTALRVRLPWRCARCSRRSTRGGCHARGVTGRDCTLRRWLLRRGAQITQRPSARGPEVAVDGRAADANDLGDLCHGGGIACG